MVRYKRFLQNHEIIGALCEDVIKTKNDKLIVLESKDNKVRSNEVEKLLRHFEEELKPLGITCHNWAKPS